MTHSRPYFGQNNNGHFETLKASSSGPATGLEILEMGAQFLGSDCLNQFEILLSYQFTITLGNETERYQSR